MFSNIRRRLFTVTGLLVLATGVAFTNQSFVQDASAAGLTTKPDIRGCFIWGDGRAYANQPVHLAAYYAGEGYKVTRSTTTNSNGCVRFNDISVHRHYILFAVVYWPTLCYGYQATTTPIYTQYANDYLYQVGTYWVRWFSPC